LEESGSLLKGRAERIRVGTIKDITERKIAEIKLKDDNDKLEKLAEEKTIELRKANELLKEDLKIRKETEEELKIAKSKIERSDRLKSEFLTQMSHEIRTPINTILSFTSLVKEELDGELDGDLMMSFEGIGNAGKRIIRTIDLMLNMSELQAGSYDYRAENIDVYGSVLDSLIFEYEPVAKAKGLGFQLLKEEAEIPVFADEYTVKQIFANLIDNAIKYSLEGEVTVTGKKTNDSRYCIEVKDTGIGISEEYIPQLFDLFTQEDQGYTRSYEGNGLGLALVKKYCDMNKAEISAESKKGAGSIFRVIFNQ
jgi:signal transduction histidine kinase